MYLHRLCKYKLLVSTKMTLYLNAQAALLHPAESATKHWQERTAGIYTSAIIISLVPLSGIGINDESLPWSYPTDLTTVVTTEAISINE